MGGVNVSITQTGIQGEKMARVILQNNVKNIQSMFQADWIYKQNDQYFLVEVKNKEIFEGPPFDGYGLNYGQIKSRLDFYKNTKIRCLFLCICEQHGGIYYQWLDNLYFLGDKNKLYLKKSKIMVFNIKFFNFLAFNELKI